MNKDFFIEDFSSSSEDQDVKMTWKQTARINRTNSPPPILAFSTTSGRNKWPDRCPKPSSSDSLGLEGLGQGEDSDQSVEEWMILDEEEQEGDSNIQLNLSYSNIGSGDDENKEMFGKDTQTHSPGVTSLQDPWAVSRKDRGFGETTLLWRYYMPGNSLMCPICKRTGHQAKNCHVQKKYPVCVLCGIRGHLQKDCPSRLCPRCGLVSHGLKPCSRPPVWHQHCQRCGMTGHLSDVCPDSWRQYHHTIKMEVPLRLQTVQACKHERRPAYCYNCSKRGHYGYDCSWRRMISGTFPSLPYVCHYDHVEEALQTNPRTQKKNTEFVTGAQSFLEPHFLEENQLYQKRNKMKQEACSQASRRKTWPERRRARQEVKRLRREAQARKEGGGLGLCQHNLDDESSYLDPFSANQFTSSSKKTKKEVAGYQRSRKSREAERWKKRGGTKHGFLYPHKELDIGSENLLSPKQRVRHRRRSSFISV